MQATPPPPHQFRFRASAVESSTTWQRGRPENASRAWTSSGSQPMHQWLLQRLAGTLIGKTYLATLRGLSPPISPSLTVRLLSSFPGTMMSSVKGTPCRRDYGLICLAKVSALFRTLRIGNASVLGGQDQACIPQEEVPDTVPSQQQLSDTAWRTTILANIY